MIRENVAGVGQVAVDWIGGNIFFTQRCESSQFFKLAIFGLIADENIGARATSTAKIRLINSTIML